MTFQDVETARKTYWDKLKTRLGVSAITSVVAGVVLSIGGRSAILYAVIITFVVFSLAAGITVFLTRKEASAYRKAYKGYFVEQNFQKIFTGLSYSHQAGLDPAVLDATEMITTGDLYNSNDLTVAKYQKVGFAQADAHIQRENVDQDGNVTYYTIFKGRVMIFEFPKKFNFKLELIGKKFHAYRVPSKDYATGRKMVKIDTESNEFNHTFKIFAQDGFETFYLLDPARIAKIQAIADRYNRKILFGFLENKMLVAIDDGKDSFEPPRAFKSIDEKAELKKVATEIKVITDFVDELSLAPIFS